MEQMEKNAIAAKSVLKALGYGALGAGALAGTGYAGHRIGFKSGAIDTADKMSNAFMEANTRENNAIRDGFMNFNKKENAAIANAYLRKGYEIGMGAKRNIKFIERANASGGSVKTASLQEVYENAFNDEMSKVAAFPGSGLARRGIDALKSGAGKLRRSFGNLKDNTELAYDAVKGMRGTTGAARDESKKWLKEIGKDTLKNSKAALGTIAGGTVLAAGAGGYALKK